MVMRGDQETDRMPIRLPGGIYRIISIEGWQFLYFPTSFVMTPIFYQILRDYMPNINKYLNIPGI